MNHLKDMNTLTPEDITKSVWIDRLSEETFMTKGKVYTYSSVAGKITVQESDLVETTPTQNVLVNEAALTANTLYSSAELTFTKRFYQIVVENTEDTEGEIIIRVVSS